MIALKRKREKKVVVGVFVSALATGMLVIPFTAAGHAVLTEESLSVSDSDLLLDPDPLLDDPVGTVTGTVEAVVSPSPSPAPEGGGSPDEPADDPTGGSGNTGGETSPQVPNGDSSRIGSGDGGVTTSQTTGPQPPQMTGQSPVLPALTGATSAIDQARERAKWAHELERIEPGLLSSGMVTTRGPRSTVELFELLRRLDFSPMEIARIMAPFPVAGRASYSDDWGAPRYAPEFHLHQGTDIFAAVGTPVIASSDGVITSMASDTEIAGNGIRLTAADGTYYYYSHLQGFAPELSRGDKVRMGDVIGFVGATGNAEGGLPHLHFEIHPEGGLATPPVPYLDRWLAEAMSTAKSMEVSQGSPGALLRAGVSKFVSAASNLAQGGLPDSKILGVSTTHVVAWPPAALLVAFLLVRSKRRGRMLTASTLESH